MENRKTFSSESLIQPYCLGYQFEDSRLLSPLAKPFISFPENSGYWNYILYPAAYLLSTVGQTGRMTLWARKADD